MTTGTATAAFEAASVFSAPRHKAEAQELETATALVPTTCTPSASQTNVLAPGGTGSARMLWSSACSSSARPPALFSKRSGSDLSSAIDETDPIQDVGGSTRSARSQSSRPLRTRLEIPRATRKHQRRGRVWGVQLLSRFLRVCRLRTDLVSRALEPDPHADRYFDPELAARARRRALGSGVGRAAARAAGLNRDRSEHRVRYLLRLHVADLSFRTTPGTARCRW